MVTDTMHIKSLFRQAKSIWRLFLKKELYIKTWFFPWQKLWLQHFPAIKKTNFFWISRHFYNMTDFWLIWQIFPWITECLKLPMLKFGQIFVPYKHLKSFFLMRVTSRQKLIRVLSMSKVPNTIYAADFHRATHITTWNETPCFVQFWVKLVRNTHLGFMD